MFFFWNTRKNTTKKKMVLFKWNAAALNYINTMFFSLWATENYIENIKRQHMFWMTASQLHSHYPHPSHRNIPTRYSLGLCERQHRITSLPCLKFSNGSPQHGDSNPSAIPWPMGPTQTLQQPPLASPPCWSHTYLSIPFYLRRLISILNDPYIYLLTCRLSSTTTIKAHGI